MAGYQRCISLALVCLWLCHHSLAWNSEPCQPNTNNNAYNDFLTKHVRKRTPRTSVVTEWENYLNKEPLNEVTQSFLKHNELKEVLEVCSDKGGLRYTTNQNPIKKTNLCISRNRFTYVTVRYFKDSGNYIVTKYNKHLILACDSVENECRPVHFEANDNDKRPTSTKGCQSGKRRLG